MHITTSACTQPTITFSHTETGLRRQLPTGFLFSVFSVNCGFEMRKKTGKYELGFTAGALLLKESVSVATLYLQIRDWGQVKEKTVSENILQVRTVASSKRLAKEIVNRLEKLTIDQLQLLVEGSLAEKKAIAWLAVCKKYLFIAEFAREVVREKFLKLDYHLTRDDYRIFFNVKAEWHSELESLTEKTKVKIQQRLFRMLLEAEIISAQDMIIPALLPNSVIDVIREEQSSMLTIFPVYDNVVGVKK